MLLSDDYFVHTHRNHVHKRAFTFNSLIQLTNVYCLTHKIYSIILLLYCPNFTLIFLGCTKLEMLNSYPSLLQLNNTNQHFLVLFYFT